MNVTIIAGSNRKDAASTKALRHIANLLELKGMQVTFIDLFETPLPFYLPDEEQSHDPGVARFRRTVEAADGIVLGTPEYHGSISGVLKNAIDHLSGGLVKGKPVLTLSASGGPVGVSSLTQLQVIIRNLHGINSPEWISVGGNVQLFAADNTPLQEGLRQRMDRAVSMFTMLLMQLRGEAVESGWH